MALSLEASILMSLQDPIVWAKPVFNNAQQVIDFEIQYSNKEADAIKYGETLVGKRILRDGIPSETGAPSNFEHFLKVYQSGSSMEFTFFSPATNRQYETIRRVMDGGVLSTTRDRHAQRVAEQKAKEQSQQVNDILNASLNAICTMEAIRDERGAITDFRYGLINKSFVEMIGLPEAEVIGQTMLTLFPATLQSGIFTAYCNTMQTGELFRTEVHYEDAAHNLDAWYDLSVARLNEHTVVGSFNDITQSKKAALQTAQQASLWRNVLDASTNAIYVLRAVKNDAKQIIDFRYEQVNKKFTESMNMDAANVIGNNILAFYPEIKSNGIFEVFCEVLQSGNTVRKEVFYKWAGLHNWFDYVVAQLDEERLVVTFDDITEQKEAALEIERQKSMLDKILKHSPSGISVTEVIRDEAGHVIDGKSIVANNLAIQFLGIPSEDYLNKPISALDPNILESPLFSQALKTLATGEPFITQYFFEPNQKWLELSVSKMDNDHLINVFTNITATKEAQLKVQYAAERLSAVFNASQSGMFTFKPERNEQNEIVDFRFVITNPSFAAYVGQTPDILEGALGSTWFPGYLHNGVFDMYKTTYLTGTMQRKNIHYYVDGLDLYLDLLSTKVGDEVLVTFTDYTELKRAQLELEKSVEELKRSNTNLEEFAYAASHDLKEPIRKVHFFADRLKNSLADKLNKDELHMFDRMENASRRMASLVDDLLTFSQVSLRPRTYSDVDLNNLVSLVLEDLELEIQQKKATIQLQNLPTVQGHMRQLQQLFQNLVGNALKYTKQDVQPQINISCNIILGKDSGLLVKAEEQVLPFYAIEVKDNGIGFDQKDAERIFNVFQRLHGNAEYRGTGVGLSIARKVAENHGGYISASSQPGEGATFTVILPLHQLTGSEAI